MKCSKTKPRCPVLGILCLAACAMVTVSCGERLETVKIELGGENFTVEVARTDAEKQLGLMYRKNLRKNRGMLFVYEQDRKLSFWMKDTKVPLSIAYITKDGTIKEIYQMEPYSLRSVESSHYVRYALEVPRGTFARLGLEEGDTIELPEGIRSR